jgi:hypothetical protein
VYEFEGWVGVIVDQEPGVNIMLITDVEHAKMASIKGLGTQ